MSDPRSITGATASVSDGESGRPLCLVLHGLGGGPYELAPLIADLECAGVRVAAPVLPGHEGPGPVMPRSSWRDWAAAAESACDDLAAMGQPVSVVGFSTGATLALYLASRRPVSSLVLLAPFLAIRYTHLVPVRPANYLGPLSRLIPNLPRRPPAIRDRDMRKWAKAQAHFRTFSIPATLSALELIDVVKPLVPGITAPTLIMQGQLDTVIEPAGATWLHTQLGSTNKTIVNLARTDHVVALDCEREQVIVMTRAFVVGQEKGVGFIHS
jgi:carboxylesterase